VKRLFVFAKFIVMFSEQFPRLQVQPECGRTKEKGRLVRSPAHRPGGLYQSIDNYSSELVCLGGACNARTLIEIG
jgi:hypothetical protein